MDDSTILEIKPLGFLWETKDPFLFCAHHVDAYPKGNDELGPQASLEGRNLGQDFTIKDGWRMYHGSIIPGFPSHPHRGFETVTIAKKGLVDHADSMGAAGRFGNGDVQWMTAGKGVQHSEMFPLLKQEEENPLEIFQVWLNLPRAKKLVEPHFLMLWSESIPVYKSTENGEVEVNVIAGALGNITPPRPAPSSWAADSANEVAIWTIKMAPGASWKIPASKNDVNRSLYFYQGTTIHISGQDITPYHSVDVKSNVDTILKNAKEESFLLMLQGKPISEPVVQYGPFVMNTEQEVNETLKDYQRTQFGGWPWPRHDQVHPRERGRFARHADGTEEIR